jgi:hypothetical protein
VSKVTPDDDDDEWDIEIACTLPNKQIHTHTPTAKKKSERYEKLLSDTIPEWVRERERESKRNEKGGARKRGRDTSHNKYQHSAHVCICLRLHARLCQEFFLYFESVIVYFTHLSILFVWLDINIIKKNTFLKNM